MYGRQCYKPGIVAILLRSQPSIAIEKKGGKRIAEEEANYAHGDNLACIG